MKTFYERPSPCGEMRFDEWIRYLAERVWKWPPIKVAAAMHPRFILVVFHARDRRAEIRLSLRNVCSYPVSRYTYKI